jgi:hypothetical protein
MKLNKILSNTKLLFKTKNLQSFPAKNFVIKYPNTSIRVDKETNQIVTEQSEIKGKKPEEMRYNPKHEINPDDFDDYHVIGAEIFKNALKDSIERYSKGGEKILQEISTEQRENDLYSADVPDYSLAEPNKYYKHFTRRSLYDMSNPKYRHMYVPSYRHKIEPFNSLHTFRWNYINGNTKEHNEVIFRRNNYIQGFIPPFKIDDKDAQNILDKLTHIKKKYNLELNSEGFQKIVNDSYNDPHNSNNEGIKEYTSAIDDLLDLLPKLNHKTLPPFILTSFFEISLNDKRVWIAMEQEILNNLHHYTITEICQIAYIATITCPKYTTLNFRQLLLDTVYRELEGNTVDLEQIYTIAFAFRNTKNKILYDKIAECFIKRKNQFIGEKEKAPGNISKMFYSLASHKPKNHGTQTYYPHKELMENLLETYEDDINNNIIKMDQEDIFRLTTSLYLMKTDSVDPFVSRIERNLLKRKQSNPESINPFTLHGILRAFSKMKQGKMCGSDKFFDEMEPVVTNHIETSKYSFQELSDILYAYSVRGSGSDKLNKLFEKKLTENIEKANNYHILHNIVWHLLFKENKDLELWTSLLKSYNLLEGRLPIYYYRPFKLAGFYLKNAFSESDQEKIGFQNIFDFNDRFYDPEQIYDYIKYEKLLNKHPEYINFKGLLNGRLFLFPLSHVVYDNMFMVHYSWEHQKMGINLWLERDKIPKVNGANRVNSQCIVHSKLMKYQGWEILDVIWEDFINLGNQTQRDKFLHEWYKTSSDLQEKKGIVKMNPKFV